MEIVKLSKEWPPAQQEAREEWRRKFNYETPDWAVQKRELIRQQGFEPSEVDFAPPQQWVQQVKEKLEVDPTPHFAWAYDKGFDGRPLPLTDQGRLILGEFNAS